MTKVKNYTTIKDVNGHVVYSGPVSDAVYKEFDRLGYKSSNDTIIVKLPYPETTKVDPETLVSQLLPSGQNYSASLKPSKAPKATRPTGNNRRLTPPVQPSIPAATKLVRPPSNTFTPRRRPSAQPVTGFNVLWIHDESGEIVHDEFTTEEEIDYMLENLSLNHQRAIVTIPAGQQFYEVFDGEGNLVIRRFHPEPGIVLQPPMSALPNYLPPLPIEVDEEDLTSLELPIPTLHPTAQAPLPLPPAPIAQTLPQPPMPPAPVAQPQPQAPKAKGDNGLLLAAGIFIFVLMGCTMSGVGLFFITQIADFVMHMPH